MRHPIHGPTYEVPLSAWPSRVRLSTCQRATPKTRRKLAVSRGFCLTKSARSPPIFASQGPPGGSNAHRCRSNTGAPSSSREIDRRLPSPPARERRGAHRFGLTYERRSAIFRRRASARSSHARRGGRKVPSARPLALRGLHAQPAPPVGRRCRPIALSRCRPFP